MKFTPDQIKAELGCTVFVNNCCDFGNLADHPHLASFVEQNITNALVFAVLTGHSRFNIPGVKLRGFHRDPASPTHPATAPDQPNAAYVTTSVIQDVYHEDGRFYFRTLSGSLYTCVPAAFMESHYQAIETTAAKQLSASPKRLRSHR